VVQVGYSVGLYARVRNIDNKRAYKELLERECYSQDRSSIEISPINLLVDIELRDAVYRDFLNMLKLEGQHKRYLKNLGLLDSSIDAGLYRTVPKSYIKRRLIGSELSRKYNLAGIPGFFQEEDFKWYFNRYNGFFVPVFDQNGYIQGLSIHLDKPFNNNQDIWFSSSDKINGTGARSWISRNNITQVTTSILLTDSLLLGNLIKETINAPTVAFQNISNSYSILRELEGTNIKDIIFVLRKGQSFKDLYEERVELFERYADVTICEDGLSLIPLGYNLNITHITNFRDCFDDQLMQTNSLKIA